MLVVFGRIDVDAPDDVPLHVQYGVRESDAVAEVAFVHLWVPRFSSRVIG